MGVTAANAELEYLREEDGGGSFAGARDLTARHPLTTGPRAVFPGAEETREESGYVVIRQADAAMFARQVDCLVAAVAAMRQEVEALKAESARRVTINHQQAKGLAARMRERAEQLCIKHGLEPRAHAASFRAALKKAVLDDMGIEDLHDLPLSGLDAARARIDTWDSWTLARKRKRIEEERHGAAD